MPPPRLLGPTQAELNYGGRGTRPSVETILRTRQAALADNDPVYQSRLYWARRDIREIERRAGKNKRGMSAKQQEKLKALKDWVDSTQTSINKGKKELARREANAARRKAQNAARKAGNPPKKAAKKAANKSAAPKKAAKRTARAPRKAQ